LAESDHFFPAVVSTKLGKVNLEIKNGRVGFWAKNPEPLIVNGKKLGNVRGAFLLDDDGKLSVDSRSYGPPGMFADGASDAAMRRIREVVSAAIEQYMKSNPGHFTAGKKIALQKDLEHLQQEITDAANHLAELRRRESALQREIDAL